MRIDNNDMLARVQEIPVAAHPGQSQPQGFCPISGKDPLCAHCGSPISPKLSAKSDFCCRGCEFVFKTLQGLGLDSYYSMRSSQETPHPRQDSSAARKYLFLDDPDAKHKFMEELSEDTFRIRLYLSGIHCAACIWILEKLPAVLKGVKSARVQFARGEIEIDFDPNIVLPSEIAYTLNSLGYPPVPLGNIAVLKEDRRKERQMLLRIGVAAVCAANTMMLSVSLFQGFFTGIEEPYASLFRWLSAAIALPAVIYSAFPFYRTAFAALLTGTLHIDLPIAAAIILTYISGIITTLKAEEYVYFDSVTTLIFLLLLGRFIQSRAVSRARVSALSPWDLLPASVRIIENENAYEKPLKDLQINDIVEVLPGNRVPSDGIVISGQSTLDNSFLTGESLPQEIKEGASILGGSINLESRLLVQATKIGSESRIGNILREIEKTQSLRTPAEDRANKLSSYFVFGVFGIASLSYLVWNYLDPLRAFDITVSFLIVTCPCALGLAIPAAVTVALGRAKKRGIFIKRSDAFEALADCEHFYFDKTGTLTSGEIYVQEFVGDDEQSLLIAKNLAAFAPLHPVAKAIVDFDAANSKEIPLSQLPLNSKHLPGRGVQAIDKNGCCLRLGSLRWLKEEGIRLTESQNLTIENWSKSGYSVSAFAIESSVTILFALSDRIAPLAQELVAYLGKRNKKIYILSGDSQGAVDSIATALGIECNHAFGELFPEQKSAVIAADTKNNCMIGDGLNDAPAMRQSDLSIGLRGGIEATIEVASLYISSGRIQDLLDLLQASEKTSRVIRNNICYAASYNLLGGTLAVLGYVDPLIAAILMPLSSITIVSYSLLSRTFRN